MHELEQFVDDCLQKLPMGFQKTGILSHNIHDVTSHNSFVIFAAFHFREPKKILNDRNKETFLGLLIHGAWDGSNSPAKGIAIGPWPLRPIDLLSKFINHDIFCVDNIKVGKINETLPDGLVELDCVAFFDELADDFSFIILDNKDFFRPHHLFNHDYS